jgi:hypothetical protein
VHHEHRFAAMTVAQVAVVTHARMLAATPHTTSRPRGRLRRALLLAGSPAGHDDGYLAAH